MGNMVRIPIKTEGQVKKRSIHVKNAIDVKRLINNTINELRNGEIDSKSANAIGYLANILLKVFETEETAQKLQEMEERLLMIIDNKLNY